MASQFSTDSNYFAQLSNEGKLKVWNTRTGKFEQEYTPDFHLTSPCTCLQFVSSHQPAELTPGKKKNKRKSSGVISILYIVLGTSAGTLLVYSVALGDLDYTISSNANQVISCLTRNYKNLIYSGANHNILCWDLENRTLQDKWKAGNEKITALMIIPKGRLLSASKNIKMWDIASKEILKTFTGHSSDVRILQFIQPERSSDSYCLSGSMGDRLISCWNLNENSDDNNAVASFLMDDVPSSITVIKGVDGATHMGVVTRSGVIHVYVHTLNGKCIKPVKPRTTIQIAADTGQDAAFVKSIPITSAAFQNDLSITICYGNTMLLTFENLVLNNLERVHCLIRSDQKSSHKKSEIVREKKATKHNNAQYLSPYEQPTVAAKRKLGAQQEVPMDKRLENLTLNKPNSKVPRGGNLAHLLLQGLHSKDKQILRSVLNRKEETVIRKTIRRLPMPAIVPLVNELTNHIQVKTVVSHTGSLWLKHLLQVHAGLLVSNPELSELLAPLLSSIEKRLVLQMPLSKLKGRLDLLISQLNVAKDKDVDEDDEPLLNYVDKDSSDSEMEGLDMVQHSDSENEWMEEDSEVDGEGAEDQKDADSAMSS